MSEIISHIKTMANYVDRIIDAGESALENALRYQPDEPISLPSNQAIQEFLAFGNLFSTEIVEARGQAIKQIIQEGEMKIQNTISN